MSKFSKTDVRYWSEKICKRRYRSNGKLVTEKDWCIQIMHRGRRKRLSLGTPNKAAAAAKARDVYLNRLLGTDNYLPQAKGAVPLSQRQATTLPGYRTSPIPAEAPPLQADRPGRRFPPNNPA